MVLVARSRLRHITVRMALAAPSQRHRHCGELGIADPRSARRTSKLRRVVPRLRQDDHSRPWQRYGDTLCARVESQSERRRIRKGGSGHRYRRLYRLLPRNASALRGRAQWAPDRSVEVPRLKGFPSQTSGPETLLESQIIRGCHPPYLFSIGPFGMLNMITSASIARSFSRAIRVAPSKNQGATAMANLQPIVRICENQLVQA